MTNLAVALERSSCCCSRYYEEGKELLACVRTALRVLGRLVQAGEDTPELRLGLGRPAVWCGVNLITGVRSHVPEWWGPDVERRLGEQ